MDLDVNITIKSGEVLALYGPSGAGKTSVLRAIAGLLKPTQGSVIVEGQKWFDNTDGTNLEVQERSIGMVFQDYALFPNMTVAENIAYALKKGQAKTIVEELIELVELQQLAAKRPQVLSGGQRQRVALARALVRQPKLLLLDEPLNALDTELRIRMQDLILALHQKYKLTTIMVSHDMLEVFKMADRVVMLQDGKILKEGKVAEVMSLERLRAMISTFQQT
jgi:molybdate transport system ATP-binding protein